MYHLYHTPAFVLGATHFGEANKRFTLFTQEFGLITASAKSVRAERSKLRYGLQDLSYAEVTLVRGHEAWKMTNAVRHENLFEVFQNASQGWQMYARIFRLLERLLAGEEKNAELFEIVRGGFFFLKDLPPASRPVKEVEIVLVLRVLFLLGYLPLRREFEPFLSLPFFWEEALVRQVSLCRSLALREINRSLQASQL